MPINKGIMGRVARTGQAALIEDSSQDPDFIPAISGLVSEVCVPIYKNGTVVGVLNIETQAPQQLTPNDLEMMSTLSEHLGIALERAELYTAVQESNQKYEMVVDNINEGIFQVNMEGKFTFLNKAWYALCGFTVEESIGKHFAKFIAPSEVKHLYEAQRAWFQNNEKSDIRLQPL